MLPLGVFRGINTPSIKQRVKQQGPIGMHLLLHLPILERHNVTIHSNGTLPLPASTMYFNVTQSDAVAAAGCV